MERITSRNNPKVKQVRALYGKKERQSSGLFLIEGIRHVGEAVEASRANPSAPALQTIWFSPEMLESDFGIGLVEDVCAQGIPCYSVTEEVFESLAGKDNPQGLLAVARVPQIRLDDLHPDSFPWGVAVVSPQDPGNIGAILRTIDAVGASGLLLLGGGVDPYHPSSVRASMGALFWRPVVSASFAEFVDWARRNRYLVYGTSAHEAIDYRSVDRFPRPLILLLGSEREGLSPKQRAACHQLLRLPMLGRATSLNLAVAAGVLLYSILERS